MFVVDASASVVENDYLGWRRVKHFIIGLTQGFTISLTDTRVGLTIFSNDATNRPGYPGVPSDAVGFFYLTNFTNSADLTSAIQRLHFFGGYTNTPAGLTVAYRTILQESVGDRPDVPNVAVVITDGAANVGTTMLSSVAAELQKKATVICVGISQNVYPDELEDIATSHDLVFNATDFSALAGKVNTIVEGICKAVPTPTPIPPSRK